MNRKNKIKAIVALAVALAFVMPGAAAFANDKEIIIDGITIEDKSTTAKNIVFDNLAIKDRGEYINIDVEGTTNVLNAGEPMLPVKKCIFEFPMGTIINDVICIHSSPEVMNLSKQIEPGPIPQPLVYRDSYPVVERILKIFSRLSSRFSEFQKSTDETIVIEEKKKEIYGSTEFYPDTWFSYKVTVGLNKMGKSTTFVVVDVYTARYSPGTNTLHYITNATVEVSYEEPVNSPKPLTDRYDLLILAPSDYIRDLEPLVDHKEDMGISTEMVCLDDVYDDEATEIGRDNAEKVKLYIEKAKRESNIKYVLLVGGYRTFFGLNKPDQQLPIRMSNLDDGAEDSFATDLYYADIYRYDPSKGYVFDDWDSNGNGIFAEWNWYGCDELDLMPDVYVGRLACRNIKEVKTVVDKIITYETETYGEEWFNKMIVISGDGFQDAPNWEIQWDTSLVPTGGYMIYAQSQLQSDPSVKGPIDVVNVTVDHSVDSIITFSEEDHLKIDPLDPDSEGMVYPAHPVAEITVPSEGDILGNTAVNEVPRAYIGYRWTKIEYNDGILKIKGKSYDPRPLPDPDYGSHTKYHIWIETSGGTVVKDYPLGESDMWWEGETETQIAMDYMSNDFEKQVLWTSNGDFTGQNDVIESISEGSGFVYFAGHGNPMVWANHYPGIPGGRGPASIYGMNSINLELTRPLFPMDKLSNGEKLPLLLVGGCHNSMIDCSLMKLLYDPREVLKGVKYGGFAPECWSWWPMRTSKGGAIGTIGCSGLGYGYLGEHCTKGLGGWINPEFFRQYAAGIHILGETYGQTIASYVTQFSMGDQINVKTVEEWIFLGDPSLKIGGYGSTLPKENENSEEQDILYAQPISPESIETAIVPMSAVSNEKIGLSAETLTEEWRITDNPLSDTSPSLVSKGEKFLVGYIEGTPYHDSTTTDPALAFSNGGAFWTRLLPAWSGEQKHISLDPMGYRDDGAYATFGNQGSNIYVMVLNDITNPATWSSIHWGEWILENVGKNGIAIASGYPHKTDWGQGHWVAGLIADNTHGGFKKQVPNFFMPVHDQEGYGSVGWYPGLTNSANMVGDIDHDTLIGYWAFEQGNVGFLVSFYCDTYHWGGSDHYTVRTSGSFKHPDVAAAGGYAYVACEGGGGIKCYVSSSNGARWANYMVDSSGGLYPKLVIDPDGDVQCYYVKNGNIFHASSSNHGVTWNDEGQVGDIEVADAEYPFAATIDSIVWEAPDEEIYANIFDMQPVEDALITNIVSPSKGIVTANITNSGTIDLEVAKWEIKVESANPLGDFFFNGTIRILKGHIISGRLTNGYVDIAIGENIEVRSSRIFGLGYINVVVTMYNSDGDTLATSSEDGFLLGRRLLLYHPPE